MYNQGELQFPVTFMCAGSTPKMAGNSDGKNVKVELILRI